MEEMKGLPEKNTHSANDEFHYHYGADGTKRRDNSDLLRTAGKVALAGPLVLCYIFYDAMLLIVWMMVGGVTAFLAGGSLLCFGVGGYLTITGVAQMSAGIFTGIGVLGFSLLILVCAVLFVIFFILWMKKAIPTIMQKVQMLRSWFAE